MLDAFGGSLWDNQKKMCHQLQIKHCIGVDEAGRGALAGPVVAAAVCFHHKVEPFFLSDSKKKKKKTREHVYQEIVSKDVCIGIGIVNNSIIDRVNILQATQKAMKIALDKCLDSLKNSITFFHPFLVAIDGSTSFSFYFDQCTVLNIIKGDNLIASIAAASIVAKVTRDHIMDKIHASYPEYDFCQNKGYGTKKHITAISHYGLTPVHRLSFSIRGINDYH